MLLLPPPPPVVDTPLECAVPSASTAHDCDNIEVTAPDLAITKLVLEVDDRFSDYGRCNICGPNHTDHHGNNRSACLRCAAALPACLYLACCISADLFTRG
jgi:hypothetical protein